MYMNWVIVKRTLCEYNQCGIQQGHAVSFLQLYITM